MARVRIISGAYGYRPPGSKHPVTKRIGDTAVVSDSEAQRLVNLKVAALIDEQTSVADASVPAAALDDNSGGVDTDSAQSPPEGDEGAAADEATTGHLDAEQLMELTKAELLKLAEEMDVDVSSSDNKAEIVAAITQTEVMTEDAPPDLSAEAPVV